MRKTFREMFKVGNATKAYPFAPLDVPEDSRGKPKYVAEKCICCAACAIACPPNAIQVHPDIVNGLISWEIDFGRCIFCGRCEEVCPTRAIWLTQEFELAVMKKEDLYESAEFKLEACSCCGKYFAPRKQIDYVERLYESMHPQLELLADADKKAAKDLLHLCPECKRKQDGIISGQVEIHRRVQS